MFSYFVSFMSFDTGKNFVSFDNDKDLWIFLLSFRQRSFTEKGQLKSKVVKSKRFDRFRQLNFLMVINVL